MKGGRLPWSGSRARSRDLGYAEGLRETWSFIQQLERSQLPAAQQLTAVRTWAFDTWSLLNHAPALTPEDFEGWLGLWEYKDAPNEAPRGSAR